MHRIPQQDLRAAERDERLLHLPHRRRQGHRRPLRHAPADGEAHRGPAAPRGAAAGHGRSLRARGPLRRRLREEEAQGAGAHGPALRDVHGAAHAERVARAAAEGRGGDRLPAAVDRRLQARSSPTWRRSSAAPRTRPGTKIESRDDDFGYRWMVLRDPDFDDLVVGINAVSDALDGRRLRRADPRRGLRLHRGRPARLLDLQLQARRVSTRSCPRPATSSATPSASSSSRRRSATSSRSSRSSSAGSRSGARRSSRAEIRRDAADDGDGAREPLPRSPARAAAGHEPDRRRARRSTRARPPRRARSRGGARRSVSR